MAYYMWWPHFGTLGPFALLVAILLLVFWIWMIIDCARRIFRNDVEKIVWIIVIILAGWIGALIYLAVIKMSNPRGLVKTSQRI